MASLTFHYRASVECRYLVDDRGRDQFGSAVFCLHGYGMNPEFMLQLARPTVPDDALLVSLQAPNAFYAVAVRVSATSGIAGPCIRIRKIPYASITKHSGPS